MVREYFFNQLKKNLTNSLFESFTFGLTSFTHKTWDKMHQTFLTSGRRILSSAVISITGRLHHKRANILQASEIFPKIGNFRKRSFHLGKRSENLRESGQLLRPRMVLL